jgi:hypothetical protein
MKSTPVERWWDWAQNSSNSFNLEKSKEKHNVKFDSYFKWKYPNDNIPIQVHHHVFKGVDHGEILRNPESAEYVKRLVLNITRDIRYNLITYLEQDRH